MSSPSPILSKDSDLAFALATRFPALALYCPILGSVSRQQAKFLLLDDREAFYGGAAGGGKSAALLMAALQYVDMPGYSALLLRRSFPQLSQPGMLISVADEWLGGTDAHRREGGREWVFPSGAKLRFGHVRDEAAVFDYQGGAYQFIGFDELTQFSESQYRYIAFSRARRDLELARVPIRIRATANPGGIGHAWVKHRLVNPDTRVQGAVYIPAKVKDNPGLDVVEYAETLSHLPDVLRQQLLEGDWGAFEGAAFQSFDAAVHVVSQFPLAPTYARYECMDYGLNNPTAWHLVAVDHDGNQIFYDTHYDPGLPSETAPIILGKRVGGWGQENDCYGDPNSLAMRTGTVRRWGEPATIQTEFQDNGVHIAKGNDNPRAGYTRLRELVEPDPQRRFPDWHPRRGEPGCPRLFVVAAGCPELIDQFQAAPLQPVEKQHAGEMVDPVWEGQYGHALAAARYGVMSRPDASVHPPGRPADTRSLAGVEETRRLDREMDRGRYEY